MSFSPGLDMTREDALDQSATELVSYYKDHVLDEVVQVNPAHRISTRGGFFRVGCGAIDHGPPYPFGGGRLPVFRFEPPGFSLLCSQHEFGGTVPCK
jgi:hypothetical protein